MPASSLPAHLALLGPLGTTELIVMAAIGLLIFGKRLPEVGKSVGHGLMEFKRGLGGIETELEEAGKAPEQIEHRNNLSAETAEELR